MGTNGSEQVTPSPRYGKVMSIAGELFLGQEASSLTLCKAGRAACTKDRAAFEREPDCWMVLSHPAATAVDKAAALLDAKSGRLPDGMYWVEGTGRLAVGPPGFGHLSQYQCQIEVLTVSRFEEGGAIQSFDEWKKENGS